jgi:hypothetical protein
MSPVPAAALSQSKNCHPEAAEPRAKASDSQRRISVPIAECTGLISATNHYAPNTIN